MAAARCRMPTLWSAVISGLRTGVGNNWKFSVAEIPWTKPNPPDAASKKDLVGQIAMSGRAGFKGASRPRHRFPGDAAGGPGGLEIEAAGDAVDVEHLAVKTDADVALPLEIS